MPGQDELFRDRSRKYARLTYCTSIAETAFLTATAAVFLASGFSRSLADAARALAVNFWVSLALFLLCISAGYYVLSFPLRFFRGFILEHQFRLTDQGIKDWFVDQAKAGALSYALSLAAAVVFYALVIRYPRDWWWMAAACWILFCLVLVRLMPVIIIPIFFRYTPVSDETIRLRIKALAQKMGVALLDVFEVNLSRTTSKANAALVGWGRTRRVILGDTLRKDYTFDEIEAILAHEFAHQKLKHTARLISASALTTLASLYVFSRIWPAVFSFGGIADLSDPAGMAAIILFFTVSGIVLRPAENLYSRGLEAAADRLALEATANPEAFITLMEKLAAQNLADRAPAPIIEFFFFDHPPIGKRIAMAEKVKRISH